MQPAIELWLVDRARFSGLLVTSELVRSVLAADEIERSKRLGDPGSALRWQCGRVALRLLLRRWLGRDFAGIPFARTASGRPGLTDTASDFSLSDCGPHLLIGLSRVGRIGVDIEAPRGMKMSAARTTRIVAVAAALTPAGKPLPTPLQAWTRVEAFAKATAPTLGACLEAIGLASRDAKRISIADLPARAKSARDEAGTSTWDLDLPHGLVGAFACRDETSRVAKRLPPSVRELDEDTIRWLMT